MIELTLPQAATLRGTLAPEVPGPSSLARHILNSGHGHYWVDQWPQARAVLCESAGNYLLNGDPAALTPADLRPHIRGVVAAEPAFAPLLQKSFPDLARWERVIFTLAQSHMAAPTVLSNTFAVRPLVAEEEAALTKLHDDVRWVIKTWATPRALIAGGYAWGAFAGDRLLSLAVTFFLGDKFEDIGVATEPAFRGHGLSAACTAGLCTAIFARGRRPSWTTSPDNIGSRRVAEKVGFRFQCNDVLYVINVAIP